VRVLAQLGNPRIFGTTPRENEKKIAILVVQAAWGPLSPNIRKMPSAFNS